MTKKNTLGIVIFLFSYISLLISFFFNEDGSGAGASGGYNRMSSIYPKINNVYETESGHVKEYDDTPGYERITERHKSGTNYEIIADGSKNETIVRDNYRLVVGQDTLEVYANVRVIISGHADIAIAGNLTAGVNGNMESTVVGNIAATSTTGNVTATSTEGDITVTTTDTTKKITLAGNVDITENLNVIKNLKVTGTTHVKENQLVDDHNHVISGGSSAGNTSNLS